MEDMNKEPSMDPDALQATLASQSETSEEDTSAHGGGRFESVISKIDQGTGKTREILSIIDDVVVAINGLRKIHRTSRKLVGQKGLDGKISTGIDLLATATSVVTSVQNIRNTTRSFRNVKD
jgi:hypothetical protein